MLTKARINWTLFGTGANFTVYYMYIYNYFKGTVWTNKTKVGLRANITTIDWENFMLKINLCNIVLWC